MAWYWIALIVLGAYLLIGIGYAIYLKYKGYLTVKILVGMFVWPILLVAYLITSLLNRDKWGEY